MTRHVAYAANFAGFARAIFHRRIVPSRHVKNSIGKDMGIALGYRNELNLDQVRAALAARFTW